MLDIAFNNIRYFIVKIFTLPHIHPWQDTYISICLSFRPLHSQVRQCFCTFSPYIFYGFPTYRLYHPPLDNFRSRILSYFTITLSRLHRASYVMLLHTNSHVGVLELCFKALPYHSTYQIISSPNK